MVFLSQKPSTKDGIVLPTVLFLAWVHITLLSGSIFDILHVIYDSCIPCITCYIRQLHPMYAGLLADAEELPAARDPRVHDLGCDGDGALGPDTHPGFIVLGPGPHSGRGVFGGSDTR